MTEDTQTAGNEAETTAKPKGKKEVVYNTIVMEDGRTVDFPGETKAMKSFEAKDGAVVGRIDFANGKTVNFSTSDMALIFAAAAHGLGQKIGDSYSGQKDPDDAYQVAASLSERLQSQGVDGWTKAREGGGSGDTGIGLLVKALMEVTGVSETDVRAYLETLDNPMKKALRESDPTVSPVYNRLKAERDAKKPQPTVDTAGALAALKAKAQG